MNQPPGKPAGIARSDIDFLGEKLDGFDPRHYFDRQDEAEASAAAGRWPRVAQWLGYVAPARDET
jgi:hypothetical protein